MKTNDKKSGFTLIEVIVAVGIFALVMVSIGMLFLSLYRKQGTDVAMIQRTHDANKVIDMISSEIRKANRAENGNFVIANAGANSLTFYSDTDNDGLTEKITYALNGADLKKTVIEPGASSTYSGTGTTITVCSGVRNGIIFTYYGSAYTGTGSPMAAPIQVANVRLIGISLDLNSTNVNSSYLLHTETKVDFRNLN